MTQAMTISHPPITAEAWVGYQASSYGIHCLRNGSGTGFSQSSLIILPVQFQNFSRFNYLSLMLWNLNKRERRGITQFMP